MKIDRSSGILMPVASLPSPYGIGTLGKAAYDFIDFLFDSNQSWWQMLPLGPTSYGDSPYQSFSTFAGNPYFVDLDMLIDDGLLEKSFVDQFDWGSDPNKVDYEKIYLSRFRVLFEAFQNGLERDREEFERFKKDASNFWLEDYALFMSLKEKYGMKSWLEWPDDNVRRHEKAAIDLIRPELKERIEFFKYVQFLFFRQWKALREYAASKGVGIIGDIPIYVALDSADVWSESHCFQVDEDGKPTLVAGVPPDYFSKDGQLWGNPLYDWDHMKEDGYGWWIRRVDGASKLYDVIRIDHFRGFESYWAVPFGEATAVNGEWIKGPGMDFVGILTSWFSGIQFIAEDLGFLTDGVRELLERSGLPGMKVLQFAFDWREPSNYLPHTYNNNCVCYIGTHDNNTLKGWFEEADSNDIEFATRYLGLNESEGFVWGLVRGGMSSVSDLFVVQLQDYLELGEDARTNIPGIVGGNWQWRVDDNYLQRDDLKEKIADITRIYGRSNSEWQVLHSNT